MYILCNILVCYGSVIIKIIIITKLLLVLVMTFEQDSTVVPNGLAF